MGGHHGRAPTRTGLPGAVRTPSHQGRSDGPRGATKSAFSSLAEVTDLVYAAEVEKPTMAETVEPNASMLKNALGALAASNVPVQRVVLAGGAKSHGFSLGSSSDLLLCIDLSKSSAEEPLVSLIRHQEDQ